MLDLNQTVERTFKQQNMDESIAGKYANAIIAVGTGKESTYIASEIAVCSKVISQIKAGNHKQAANKISEILKKQNIQHCKADIELISNKIVAYLN